MRLVEDLGIRLLAREPHQVIVGHAAETAVPDWIETWSSTWPTTRTRLRVFSPEPPRACADARHYAADAAFGEKRDAGARTSHQCRTLFVVVGLQQLFESEGMSAIEIERPAAERQGEGRRAAGSLDKSAKRLHPGSRFLGSATSIRSVPRLGPHFDHGDATTNWFGGHHLLWVKVCDRCSREDGQSIPLRGGENINRANWAGRLVRPHRYTAIFNFACSSDQYSMSKRSASLIGVKQP